MAGCMARLQGSTARRKVTADRRGRGAAGNCRLGVRVKSNNDTGKGRGGRPTSFDIAYRAGVSQSTVSRALRGDKVINDITRKRIEAIARELNYQVDKNASNLRRQHTSTIALLFFEDPTPDDSLINPFFLSMIGSITQACARRGYDLLISFQQLSNDWHKDYEDSRKADGLILLGYGDYLEYRAKLDQLQAYGTHFVRWGAPEAGQPGGSVGCDNVLGGQMAVRHLIGLRRRAIAFLGNASGHYPEFHDRFRGYGLALTEAGLTQSPALQVDAAFTEQAGYDAAGTLIGRGVPFDAIFAASDLIAIGAMRALQERGRAVPEAVSVVGFDDIAVARHTHPPLTTVAQDPKAAGETLVEALMQRIRGEAGENLVLPAKLIVRRSCGAPG